ncbi:MAG: Rpn family recombination-promoting nuclease/putative transposase [Bacteroidales bacterium]|nr:Rpn family recombination-promoting nuclease/putative transposase [Bacteroidales bacterium]
METTRSMISFDWAMKRLLRNKANFEVLEGFLSELLRRKIIIKSIIESEGNKTDEDDKSNKVDILVEADDRELVIIELQYDSEADYFHRMLYGVSKAITEHIREGDSYSEVRKVYSVNIVYFDLGKGDDYIYHGITNFKGLHTHNELILTATQRQIYHKNTIGELYPEYYIVKVRGFDDVAKNSLDEWIYYLKNNRIKDDFKAQGLDKARQILAVDNLSDEEKRRYYRSIEERRIKEGEIHTALLEGEEKGWAKGEAIGLEKGEAIGLEKGKTDIARNLLKDGVSVEDICKYTGLSKQQIQELTP